MTASEALYLVKGWFEGSSDGYLVREGKIPEGLRAHKVWFGPFGKGETFRDALQDILKDGSQFYRLHCEEKKKILTVTFLRRFPVEDEPNWTRQLKRQNKLTNSGILELFKKKGLKFSPYFSVRVMGSGDPFGTEEETNRVGLKWSQETEPESC